MGDDKKDKKISGVGSSTRAKEVEKTSGVGEIEKVKGATAVKGVKGVLGVGKAGAIGGLTFAQRERLMGMITEEAEKLAADGTIPKSQQFVVERAVKMAIDAALLEPDEDPKGKK